MPMPADSPHKDSSRAKIILITLCTFLVLTGLYISGYFLLVKKTVMIVAFGGGYNGHGNIAEYKDIGIDQEFSKALFHPIHVLDRKIRPSLWGITGVTSDIGDDKLRHNHYYIHGKEVTKSEWEAYQTKQKKQE